MYNGIMVEFLFKEYIIKFAKLVFITENFIYFNKNILYTI